MDSTKICMVGLLCVFLCILLKEIKSPFSVSVKIASVILLFLVALSVLAPLVTYFKERANQTETSSYVVLILKALGISFCTQISADICRDTGENSLASSIELVGKAEILLLSVPLIKQIIELAEGVLA